MDTSYRTFRRQDISEVVNLINTLGYQHNETSLMRNLMAVRQQGGEIFVAEVNGQVCGCVSAIVDVRLAEGTHGEIGSLVIADAVRGEGMGKGLILIAESWLTERTSHIRIRVQDLCKDRQMFYAKLGYEMNKALNLLQKSRVRLAG